MESGKRVLIVGIDPGTTKAYACLDLEGSLVAASSSKELSFNSLVQQVSSIGLPVLVAGDKAAVPSFVRNFSAKTGARLVVPKADLGVDEKKSIVSGYAYSDSHVMDAIASALFAFRKNRALIKKLDLFIKKHNKQDIAFELQKNVIAKGLPIALVAELLEKKPAEHKPGEQRPAQGKDNGKSAWLLEKNRSLAHELSETRAMNKELSKKIDVLENKLRVAEKKEKKAVQKEKIKQGMQFQEKVISNLKTRISSHEVTEKELRKELGKLYSVFAEIDSFLPVRRLDNLGTKAADIIRPDDKVLYVKNPGEYSSRTLDSIKGKVLHIIAPNPPKMLKKSFCTIDEKQIQLIRPGRSSPYFFVRKDDFERISDKSELLDILIRDYKDKKYKRD